MADHITDQDGNSSLSGPTRCIFLLGFMGTGKTHWGRIWSQKLGLDFYDLDELIEADQEKTIPQIFEKHGEDHFRNIEAVSLRSFAGKAPCIVSCGGGTACFKDNMPWMNEHGITVYLSATPQYIFNRVMSEKDKRPLMKKINQAELLFFIEQKLKEREPFYSQAKYILPAGELGEESLGEVLRKSKI